MPDSRPLSALVATRTSIGLGALLAPRLAGRPFGLDARSNPQSPYLARLFGVRDLALAVGALTASPSARRHWLAVGVACDVTDVFSGVAGMRAGYLSRTSGLIVSATAAAAVALGLAAASAAGAPS
jgi:hypothetical protein